MTKNVEDMTAEELQAYEDELNKEIKLRDIKRKAEELKIAKEEEAKKEQEEAELIAEEKALEKIYADRPELRPKELIPDTGTEGKNGTSNAMANYYKRFTNANAKTISKSGYEHDRKEELESFRFQVYENQEYGECGIDGMWGNTNSDSGCADVIGDWSPADTYAKVIWETFVCTADLMRICVKGLSINPGDGLDCQIRVAGALGDPASLTACECASCSSITWTTKQLTLKQYNLEAIVCKLHEWDAGKVIMDSYLKAMSNSWAQWFDKQIYAALEAATPGTTEQLAVDINCTPAVSGSCCTDPSLMNLYNAINALVASMREGTNPYDPDYCIISPTVANIFKRFQTPTQAFPYGDVQFDSDGRLKKVGGMKVIEYCGANSCTDLADEVVAIVIDSRRAVGCVFGQKPQLYKYFATNCNSTRLDMWAFVAIGALDLNAIGHVINAS